MPVPTGGDVSRLTAPSAAVLVVALASLVSARAAPDETERNRAIVTAFAHRFYDERDVPGAFDRYVASDYVQHNPGIGDGRAAAVAVLSPMFARARARFEVKRILVDGDMAAIHLRGQADPASSGGAVIDLYRLKNGRIV